MTKRGNYGFSFFISGDWIAEAKKEGDEMAFQNNMEAREQYEKFLKLGKKEKDSLLVLDILLKEKEKEISGEINLGVVSIPLEKVIGTKTEGRSISFSSKFYPMIEEQTEFAAKWINLYRAHLEEGIRDPIKAYEYMNRFYVQEGNKRVSVLKCVGAVSVMAEVIRILPFRTEEKANKVYYEFMDFYRLSGIYDLELSEEGGYAHVQRLIGKRPDETWTEEDRRDFCSLYYQFENIYQGFLKGGKEKNIGDAFLNLLYLYDYRELLDFDYASLKEMIKKSMEELKLENIPELQMEPGKIHEKKRYKLPHLFSNNTSVLKVAFVHEKTAETSSWTYAHELGRMHLEEVFPEQIVTSSYENATKDTVEMILEQSIADGNQLIFTTSPPLLKGSLHVAMEHPDVKILNCSLNTSHKYIRTYYARMYEAKFLMGAIAGAMTENGRIGYLADYPIYGMTANINAFALGAKMINPRAKIYLEWTTLRGRNPFEELQKNNVSCISGQDMIIPKMASRHFGLYLDRGNDPINLAMPVWHWGKFYEQMIQKIINGAWKEDETRDARGINYWWGMSADVIDVICSKYLPIGTTRLIELLKETIRSDTFNPFSGVLYSQKGIVQKEEEKVLNPEDIITMNWLAENVIGYLPNINELLDKAKPVVSFQGLQGEGHTEVHHEKIEVRQEDDL